MQGRWQRELQRGPPAAPPVGALCSVPPSLLLAPIRMARHSLSRPPPCDSCQACAPLNDGVMMLSGCCLPLKLGPGPASGPSGQLQVGAGGVGSGDPLEGREQHQMRNKGGANAKPGMERYQRVPSWRRQCAAVLCMACGSGPTLLPGCRRAVLDCIKTKRDIGMYTREARCFRCIPIVPSCVRPVRTCRRGNGIGFMFACT